MKDYLKYCGTLGALFLLISCSQTIDTRPNGVNGGNGGGSSSPSGGAGGIGDPAISQPMFNRRSDPPIDSVVLGAETMPLYAHPRIWLTPDGVTALKAKAVSSNEMWKGLQYSVDAGISSGSYRTIADGGTLINYAAAWLATGSASYLSAAKTMLLNYPALYSTSCDGSTYCGNDNIDYGSMDLMYLAAAFDWLHDQMSPMERQSVTNWVYGSLIPFLRKHPYYGDALHNLGHTKWSGEFLWSLATIGDDSRALPLFQSSYTFWTTRILPILDDAFPGGHTYSGSGYGYNRVFKYQLYAFEAVWTAMGLDMYARHPWPIDEALYRIHSTLPVDGQFFSDWESAEGMYNQGRMNENEAILAYRYQGSYAGKLAQFWIQNDFRPRAFANQGGNRVNPIYVGLWFLWYDPTLASQDYAAVEPTAYKADGLGLFLSRENWHDATSTFVSLSAAKYIGDHQLHNEGSFKIFKKEHLVIENGNMYSGQASNLTPTDTNIMFLGNGAVDYGEITGGLYRRSQGSLAHVERFEADDAERFAYAKADLTTAYMPSYFPVDFFHRNMVHLKSVNGSTFDYVVLYDRIRSRNAVAKKAFVHLATAPSVSGNVATASSTNHLSRLAAVNLLPESTAFSVDPEEYSDAPSRLVLTKTTPAAKEDQFLSVFAVTDDMSATAPSIERVDSSDGLWIGALVLDGAGNRVALFSLSDPASTGEIQYSVAKTAATKHAIFDLTPGTTYSVSVSGTDAIRAISVTPDASGSFTADAQGVLVFTDN
jgi:hypothetical protein